MRSGNELPKDTQHFPPRTAYCRIHWSGNALPEKILDNFWPIGENDRRKARQAHSITLLETVISP
jgi:hypothetical protein